MFVTTIGSSCEPPEVHDPRISAIHGPAGKIHYAHADTKVDISASGCKGTAALLKRDNIVRSTVTVWCCMSLYVAPWHYVGYCQSPPFLSLSSFPITTQPIGDILLVINLLVFLFFPTIPWPCAITHHTSLLRKTSLKTLSSQIKGEHWWRHSK